MIELLGIPWGLRAPSEHAALLCARAVKGQG